MANKNFIVRNGITVGSWNLVDENGNVNANTLNLLSGFSSLNVVSFTASTITANNFGNIRANNITANNFGNVTANTYSYTDGTGPGFSYFLDDISAYFNGIDTTFNLTVNGNAITPNNANQLDIKIGNVPIYPSNFGTDLVNLSPISTKIFTRFNYQGFTVSGNTITFTSPPLIGMNFFGLMRNNNDLLTQITPTKTVPFDELNIMFSY